MTLRTLFLLLSVLLGVQTAQAADAQLWLNTGVRFRPTKKVSFDLDQQLRLYQNVSRLETVITDLSVAWRVKKWFQVGGGYRFEMESNKNGKLEPAHRLHIQARLKEGFGPVDLSYRLRFQEKFEDDDGVLEVKHTLRNRIGASFDTDTALTPGISMELFTRFGEEVPVLLQKFRLTTGLDIRANKSHVIGLFYRLHVPIFDGDDPLEHIVGLGYQYRLPRKKKSKK